MRNKHPDAKQPSIHPQHVNDTLGDNPHRTLGEKAISSPVLEPPLKQNTYAGLRQDYETYLRHERGLGERSIFNCWYYAERFLKFRFGDGDGNLSTIRQTDIAEFMQLLYSQERPYRVKTSPSYLRCFFQYLFKVGKTQNNLALGIPTVTVRYDPRLPRHLTPEQVEAVIVAVHSDTPMGRRNHAMVLLLALSLIHI